MIRESFNTLFDAKLTASYVAGKDFKIGDAFTTGEAGHWIGESFNPIAGKNCKLVVYATATGDTVSSDVNVKVTTKQTPAQFVVGSNSALSVNHVVAEYTIPKEKIVANGAPVAEFVLGDDVENYITVSAKGDTGVSIRVEFVPYA